MERICAYEYCFNEILGRKDKRYCCRKHKGYARKKRRLNWLKMMKKLNIR